MSNIVKLEILDISITFICTTFELSRVFGDYDTVVRTMKQKKRYFY